MNDDLTRLLRKNEKEVIELFHNNAEGRCFLSRRVFEDRLCKPRQADGMSNRTLSTRLERLTDKRIVQKIVTNDGGVFYVLSSFATKYPKAIDMVRNASSRGMVSAIFLIDKGSPDQFVLINISQPDSGEIRRRGRPPTFQSDKST